MKKYLIIILSIFNFFDAFSQNTNIITQTKKQFFPLEIGNKYYYATLDGRKYRDTIKLDTSIIIDKHFYKEYTVYSFNNRLEYYVKNDSVFSSGYGQDGHFMPNLLYYKVKNTAQHYLHQGSCGIYGTVDVTHMNTCNIENTIYKDCYKFLFCSENCSETIIAFGIGILQTIRNGKKTVLTAVELK